MSRPSPDDSYGPGPIIIPGTDTDGRVLVRHHNQPGVQTLTHTEICNIPIRPQWFAGTRNGLIASWPTLKQAQGYALESTTLLGRIQPITIEKLLRQLDRQGSNPIGLATIVILTDPHGTPLRGQP